MPNSDIHEIGDRPEPENRDDLQSDAGVKAWLKFIAEGGEQGRMVLQITATGGRASSQLQALRNAGWVEYWDDPDQLDAPDRIRITTAGKKALAANAQEPITYRRDDDRYIVYLGEDRLGFTRREDDGRWKAVDTAMSYSRWFGTRGAAGKALYRRFVKMMREGRL